jgi:HK97 family phage major capsid protein
MRDVTKITRREMATFDTVDLRDGIKAAEMQIDEVLKRGEKKGGLSTEEQTRLNELDAARLAFEKQYEFTKAKEDNNIPSIGRESKGKVVWQGDDYRAGNWGKAAVGLHGGGINGSTTFTDNFRAVLTPSTGSGEDALWTGTKATTELQRESDMAILGRMTIESQTRNNTVIPHVTREDAATVYAQYKGYLDALSEQAFSVSGFTTAFKNAFGFVAVANDLLRDGAGDVGALIQQVSMRQVQKSILQDILTADGTGNKITGLDNLSGVQTLAAGATSVSNFSQLIKAKTPDCLKKRRLDERIGFDEPGNHLPI